jgi:hypothetical protein
LCICWIYDGLFREFKYAFPRELVFASKSLRLDKRCRVATFQFHAINKIKLPLEVKGTSTIAMRDLPRGWHMLASN